MKTINDIISEIEKLESEFNIFNSRIFEFANSTNQGDIDKGLLKEYIGSIKDYLKLIQEYKKDVSNIDGDKEYEAQKSIVLFRLEKLNKIFDNTLKKLEIISNTLGNDVEIYEESDVDFHSRDEMLNINKYLYEFYNNYNKNLEFQKNYNIKISLNNDFESKIEKESTSLELVEKENIYMLELNEIFETLEELDIDFYNLFNEGLKEDNRLFSNLSKTYFNKNKESFIHQTFKENFKDEYENSDFNVKSNVIYKDFIEFKKPIEKEFSYINIILSIYKFIKEYNKYLLLENKHNLFSNITLFTDVYNIYSNITKNNYKNSSEIIEQLKINLKLNNISELNEINKILSNSLILLENYDSIFEDYAYKLKFGFIGNFYSLINKSDFSDQYITKGLLNIKNNFEKDIKNLSLEIGNLNNIKLLDKIIETCNSDLLKIKDSIIFLNNYISNNIVFSSGSTITGFNNTVNNRTSILKNAFNFSEDTNLDLGFDRYLNNIVKSKYNSSKSSYYAKQRARNSSRSSFGSSGSSSSWGSSSSSFSSSYSSSGSSSW